MRHRRILKFIDKVSNRERAAMAEKLPRTIAVISSGIDANLHLGAQLYVSVAGETIANLALGQAREGVPLRTDHMIDAVADSTMRGSREQFSAGACRIIGCARNTSPGWPIISTTRRIH